MEELGKLVGIDPVITVIRSGRLRWYGHVMRKKYEYSVKKCLKIRVEGRRPVGRPSEAWLENVEADMAEQEIDREDIHDRKKWRQTVMKKKYIPIREGNINHINIIIIEKYHLVYHYS